jgi:hypothetical protein
MPVPGTKIKPEGQRRTRHAPTHDWTEVENIPFAGAPALPRRSPRWPAATRRWWSVVSAMPHCKLWTGADWQYAIDTAEVHARFVEGGSATELRIREQRMGTTMDARRDLRIRYVDPKPEQQPGRAAAVVSIDDYR